MPISFPTSPSNGDTHVIGSITYQYDSTDDKWTGLGITPSDRLLEGSNSLEIDANNNLVWTGDNVGINDTSPDNKLHITTTSSSAYSTNTTNTSNLTNALLKLQNLDGSDGTGANNYVGIQFSVANGATSTAQMQYVRTGDNAGKFEFKARNTSSNYPNIMTLLSSGDVGINQTSPTSQSGKVLHISGDTGGQARIHLSTSASGHGVDEGHYIVSQGAESGANAGQLAIINMENRNITFTTGTAGANTTRLTVQHDGNLNIADGNLIVASGHGIDFSATTDPTSGMTSELFDNYEEGSWVPVIENTSTAPSYSNQVGRYTRIGRVVFAQGMIQTSSTATYDNNNERLFISGLPYARSNTNSVGYTAAQGTVQAQSFNFDGSNNDYSVTGQVGVGFGQSITGGETGVMFYVTQSGGIRGTVKNSANAGNSFILEFTVLYVAD